MAQRLSPLHSEVSLHSEATPGGRPLSDRADDVLPRGTVFRWNPYVSTPTGALVSPTGALGSPIGGGRLAVGAPVRIITPRAETTAAVEYASTPLAEDPTPLPQGAYAAAISPGAMEALGPAHDHHHHAVTPAGPEKHSITIGQLVLSTESDDPLERALVALIEEPRDAVIRERVLALEQEEANRLYAFLVHHTEVADYLCTQHRGKLLADVIEAAAGALHNADLFKWVLARIGVYAFHQSGCIAISRVYDVVPTVLRALVDDWVALRFTDLAPDQYGNYVVQRVMQGGNTDILDSFSRQLRSKGVVATLTTSKAGSHVVERFVQIAPIEFALPVCRQLLGDAALVHGLADDRYGNYVVQACLRKIFECRKGPDGQPLPAHGSRHGKGHHTDPPPVAPPAHLMPEINHLAEKCLEEIPPIVADTKNAANIHRSMGLRFTAGHTEPAPEPAAGVVRTTSAHVAGGGYASPASSSMSGEPRAPPAPQRQTSRLSASALRRGGAPGRGGGARPVLPGAGYPR